MAEDKTSTDPQPQGAGAGLDIKGPPRIGVFVCHCGVNIGGFLDVPAVAEYAKTLPNVVHAEHNLFTCAADGLKSIQDSIKQYNLNRVIVASCTPRTHQPLFQSTCVEAGLNKYLFNFVNIREQCSWVHMKEGEQATQKAKQLIKMGVAHAVLLEPREEQKVPVLPIAVVIGGGVSGMAAAKTLGNMGFETHLIEKESELGGYTRHISTLYQTGRDANESIQGMINDVRNNKKVKIHLNSTLKKLKGYIGNYDVTIAEKTGKETNLKVGTLIVATGAEPYVPKNLYGYGETNGVITMTEFEKMVKAGKLPENLKSVAFILCVGARGQDKPYCSRICCTIAVKNAIKLVDLRSGAAAAVAAAPAPAPAAAEPEEPEEPEEGAGDDRRARRRERRDRRRRADRGAPEAEGAAPRTAEAKEGAVEVTIFNRGITTYGVHHELMYNEARGKRVRFNRFVPERIPQVTVEDGKLCINYFHETLQMDRKLYPDLIVLATPLVQHQDAGELSKILKVPLGQDKFFLEAHVKLRPVDFATDGIYLCGTAHAPADINESIAQAYAAASHAAIPMARGHVLAEAIVSVIKQSKCTGCGTCIELCPYGAIVKNDEGKAEVNAVVCKGCGTCSASCPEKAVNISCFTDEQITEQIKAALTDGSGQGVA